MKNRFRQYLTRIKKILASFDPFRVILFGSMATENAVEGSDIDLIVVLKKPTMSKNFKEKMAQMYPIQKALEEINKEIGLDLIVYSKPEWDYFLSLKSAFSSEIETYGKILL